MTGHEGVPRVIENDLLLLRDESNTQHVDRTGRECDSSVSRGKSFCITRGTHSRPVLWTCCIFDLYLSRSKLFSITRGTPSCPVLETCCVFDSGPMKYTTHL
jgi:hypothetical protein